MLSVRHQRGRQHLSVMSAHAIWSRAAVLSENLMTVQKALRWNLVGQRVAHRLRSALLWISKHPRCETDLARNHVQLYSNSEILAPASGLCHSWPSVLCEFLSLAFVRPRAVGHAASAALFLASSPSLFRLVGSAGRGGTHLSCPRLVSRSCR